MSDPTKEVKGILSALMQALDKDQKAFIGIALMGCAAFALIFAPSYFANRAKPSSECWDLKEVKGTVVKLNKCTGDVEPVNLPKATSSSN